jgi:predicted metal-dependent peptidase
MNTNNATATPKHQTHPVIIDPSTYPADHPMSTALRLVSRHWFLAYSKLMSMRWEWSTRVPYGATDGHRLLLNRKGLEKLAHQPNGVGLTAFLLVHEALHALLGHGWRCANMRDKRTANVAADYVINAMIAMRNRELGREVFPFIEGVLLDESLSGDKSVEQLYRELVRPDPDAATQPQPQPQPQGSNEEQDKQDSEEGSGQESQDDETQDGDGDPDCGGEPDVGDRGGDADNTDDSGEGGSDDDSPCPEDGDGVGHGEGDAVDAPDGGDLSDFVGTGADDTFAPDPEDGETYDEVTQRIEEDNDRILMADEIDRRSSGQSGATGQRVASQRVDSNKLDWADLCREWLNQRVRLGWDSPFNHSIYGATKLVCAGRRSNKAGTIVLVLDTSGSIGAATYAKFLAQAQDILDDLKPESLILLSVSHAVMDARTLETGDMVPDTLKGGGGTAFQPAFDWLVVNDIEPDVMIYLTDGDSCDLATLQPVDYPLLWLSTYKPASAFPIGEVLEITNM